MYNNAKSGGNSSVVTLAEANGAIAEKLLRLREELESQLFAPRTCAEKQMVLCEPKVWGDGHACRATQHWSQMPSAGYLVEVPASLVMKDREGKYIWLDEEYLAIDPEALESHGWKAVGMKTKGYGARERQMAILFQEEYWTLRPGTYPADFPSNDDEIIRPRLGKMVLSKVLPRLSGTRM